MTVSSLSNRIVYTGNGSATAFPFAFRVASAADLAVIFTDATGTDHALAPGQYGVSGLGAEEGGSVAYPLSGPPIATLAVVNILWAWNELLLALVFLQDPDKHTLMVGIAGFRGRYSLDIPTVMAGLTLVTLPLVLAYLFGQRFFIQGLTAGGIKGE
mgnify:CR=1 FL=1